METPIINVKVELDESLMSLLKLKLQDVKYEDLNKMFRLISDELKRRDSAIGFRSTPKGNYP